MKKSRESLARALGYACVLGIVVLAGFLAETIRRETSAPLRLIRVHFPELGTLMEDDPVLQEGVAVGRVRTLDVDGIQSMVELEMFRIGSLPEDSRFVNFNHSLMGARMVVLVPGQSDLKMDERMIQDGRFAGGVAETVHRVDDLLNLVISLRKETIRIFTGPQAPFAPGGLPKQIDLAIQQLEFAARKTEKAGRDIKAGLKEWGTAGKDIRSDIRDAKKSLNPAWTRLESTFRTMVAVEKSVGSALAPMEELLASFQDSESGFHTLLNDRKEYDKLVDMLHTLQKALTLLGNNGTDIIHYRNLRFFKHDTH